ncbi:MAG: DUF3097 family protein [Actinobacteria bacterium]|uniref:Unannotated protein n=1 Tax=freshwater metagenome TaxID=449393 RepID=A0A6J5YK02_9ZZZZ|nr:DUF3097 family protein [Actinomycetota bacterium]MTA78284.1 DUF3097 family protein [Actinomycetota bacterium]
MAETPYRRGILSEPLDLDGDAPRVRKAPPRIPADAGLEVEVRGTPLYGVVVSCDSAIVTIRDRMGRDHKVRLRDGAFDVQGKQVTLVRPTAVSTAGASRTASGSVAVAGASARIARASRLLVEGVHDAELVEKVWGDDLRVEGVVVELLDGADNLVEIVRGFGPRPGRRLGILLDHLVDDSKESRIAAGVDHPDVLVTGHPFVDIWAAVKPAVVGIERWPDVPKGQSWKDGVCAALGVDDPRLFWKRILNSVSSWTDLEPQLIGAVEQLIDFVTEPA